ncbi:MAG: hypothetical protein E6Q95_06315 [Chitinophagaceae bacterium]|nr:MAG: hypothetical protein E6Q95_06315 [Chitinophagaceae bacterium]
MIQTLAQNFLNKSIDQCSIEELAQKVSQEPTIGLYQLLYAYKLKKENHPDYSNQWQKTLLYFNNPLFLQYIIEKEEKNKASSILEKALKDSDNTDLEFNFTPYHTIDYFAALGIRLTPELNANDKFGNQLRSFTDWLKEMRRLPNSEVKTNIPMSDIIKIEKLAQSSLAGDNADTEAMAKIWQQQGNINKALEIYKKLSLQNPSKRAYFAAKIEFLKKEI